nr:nucleotidyltransferase family protein [Gemmatimonadota bacterium]
MQTTAAHESDDILADSYRITPEQQLLLQCARLELQPGDSEKLVKFISRPVDWDRLFQLARYHSMTPFLLRHLHGFDVSRVPSGFLSSLQVESARIARYSLSATRELRRILRLLKQHGIRALSFKGPLLAAHLYGDLSLREFGDLDILLRKEDVLRVCDILSANDYRSPPHLAALQDRGTVRTGYHIHLAREVDGLHVELHWRLDYSASFGSLEELWPATERVIIAGEEFRTLPRGDLLLYLCSHGARHRWVGLEWIVSVAELLRQDGGLDWPTIRARAEALRVARRLRVGLLLAADLLDAPLPQDVSKWARGDRRSVALALRVTRELLADPPGSSTPGPLRHLLFVFQARDRARDGFGGVSRKLFLPGVEDVNLIDFP